MVMLLIISSKYYVPPYSATWQCYYEYINFKFAVV